MGTFVNVPDDKQHLLSEEERQEIKDRRNGVLPEENYVDVVSRELNESVDSPAKVAKRIAKK